MNAHISFTHFEKLLALLFMSVLMAGCSQGAFTTKMPTEMSAGNSTASQPTPTPASSETNPGSTPTPPSPTPSEPPSKVSKSTNGSGGTRGDVTETCPSRSVALHIPSGYQESRPTAIVVAMHGLGDNYQNFNAIANYVGWHKLADEKNFIFMVPSSRNSDRKSFLYFNADGTANTTAIRDEGESLLNCIYRDVGRKYNIETTEIYWIGFSEGASFTAFMANYLSNQLKAVAIYGGSAPRNPSLIQRQLPIYFLTGTQDYSYNAIVTQSAQWTSHPHQRNFVQASHSFRELNAAVSPRIIFDFMSQTAAPPVQSTF